MKRSLFAVLALVCLIFSGRAVPINGSFEANSLGTTINAPVGSGDVVDSSSISNWRFVKVNSASCSFSATITSKASAGRQAIALSVSNPGGGWTVLDQDGGVSMQKSPVVYGQQYLVSFDASWISGVTSNNLQLVMVEYDAAGTWTGTQEILGQVSVYSTGYRTYCFPWTPHNPGARQVGFQFMPAPNTGIVSLNLDNVRIVANLNPPIPANGSFEYSPLGGVVAGSKVDDTTLVGWRYVSSNPTFTNTIVTNASGGKQALRMDLGNTSAAAYIDQWPASMQTPVTYGQTYLVTCDCALIPGTPANSLYIDAQEFASGGGTFVNTEELIGTAAVTSTNYRTFAFVWTLQNPSAGSLSLKMGPNRAGSVLVDNVKVVNMSTLPQPWNGSFEYSPLGGVISGSKGDDTTLMGWRYVSSNPTFTNTVVTNAFDGKQALRMDLGNTNAAAYIDQWPASMQTPVTYGQSYLVTCDCARVRGTPTNSLYIDAQEFASGGGTFLNTEELIGTAAVTSTNYQTFAFVWTLQNPSAGSLSLKMGPNRVGSVLVDNIKVVNMSSLPQPWNGSFEFSPLGASVDAPHGNVIDTSTIHGWRLVNVNRTSCSFTATITTNASSGDQAIELSVNNPSNGWTVLDQDGGASMQKSPVAYGQQYLVSFDASWISGLTSNNLQLTLVEYDAVGASNGTQKVLGQASVSSTSYRTYSYPWTPQNPGTRQVGFQFMPAPNNGPVSLNLDNVQIVAITNLPMPVNGSFEYSPLGATVSSPQGNLVDSSTIYGWRFVNANTGSASFSATITTNASAGCQAIELRVNNPSGGWTVLDQGTSVPKSPVVYGQQYLVCFDACWISGITSSNLQLALVECDAGGAWTASQVLGQASISSTEYRTYSYLWTPQNPGTGQVGFQFMLTPNAGTVSLNLDNVRIVPASVTSAPVFSGLTASPSISNGAISLVLSGNLSASGPVYPRYGERVSVTINGNTQYSTVNDSAGDFSINYNPFTIPASGTPYVITYSYAGSSVLSGATDTSTTLAVNQSMSSTPTNIALNASGNSINLSWPGDHLGWIVQSNSVSLVDTNYWFNIAGSASRTSLNIPINRALSNVFYRLASGAPTPSLVVLDLTPGRAKVDLHPDDPAVLRRHYDEVLLATCVQGLVNRDEPRLFVRYNAAPDDFWFQKMTEPGGWMAGRTVERISSVKELLEKFPAATNGLVVWDERVPATMNVAATVAGVEDLLAVRFDELEGSLYRELTSGNTQLKIVRKLLADDGSPLFTGKGNISQTSRVSTGSAKNDAYVWLLENYIKSGKTNPRILGYYIDAFWLKCWKASALQNHTLNNLDYLIANRGAIVDLDVWEDESPVDDPTQASGTDVKTLREILMACVTGTQTNEMISIFGFPPWAFKYTSFNGAGKHDGVPTEWKFAEIMSAYNAYMDADALSYSSFPNASFYRHYGVPEVVKQDATPTREKLIRDGVLDAEGHLLPVNYYAFYQGDYDGTAWVYWQFPKIWGDGARGTLPLTWCINPTLAQRFPFGMHYLRKTSAPHEVFVAGEGAGYLNPALLQSPRPEPGLPDALDLWVAHNTKWYGQWDIAVTGFNIDGNTAAMNDRGFAAYQKFSPGGIGLGKAPSAFGVEGQLPYLRMMVDLPTQDGAPVNEATVKAVSGFFQAGTPNFVLVRSILESPSYYAEIQNRLQAPDNPPNKLVDMPTLFWLVREFESNPR